jgi:multiple sugar transport system permease protein
VSRPGPRIAGALGVAPAARPAAARAWWRGMTFRRLALAYALVAPVVLWRLATSLYPFLYTAFLSFFDRSPVRRTFDFVGADNYVAMTQDPGVHDTVAFTVFFTVVSVSLQVVLGLAVAELLNRRFRFRHVVRAINLLPWAMPLIVIGTAANWIFNQDYGLINDIVWRVAGTRPLWLVDPTSARMAVTLTDVWKNTPFLAVIFIGGLQGIPQELYEAARVDGASGLRAYWSITLPLLLPLVITMAIFVAIYRVLSFDIVYALTQGGPGTATSLMSWQVYVQGFRVLNFGYASALAMAMFAMVLVVGLVGYWLLRRAWARL